MMGVVVGSQGHDWAVADPGSDQNELWRFTCHFWGVNRQSPESAAVMRATRYDLDTKNPVRAGFVRQRPACSRRLPVASPVSHARIGPSRVGDSQASLRAFRDSCRGELDARGATKAGSRRRVGWGNRSHPVRFDDPPVRANEGFRRWRRGPRSRAQRPLGRRDETFASAGRPTVASSTGLELARSAAAAAFRGSRRAFRGRGRLG